MAYINSGLWPEREFQLKCFSFILMPSGSTLQCEWPCGIQKRKYLKRELHSRGLYAGESMTEMERRKEGLRWQVMEVLCFWRIRSQLKWQRLEMQLELNSIVDKIVFIPPSLLCYSSTMRESSLNCSRGVR